MSAGQRWHQRSATHQFLTADDPTKPAPPKLTTANARHSDFDGPRRRIRNCSATSPPTIPALSSAPLAPNVPPLPARAGFSSLFPHDDFASVIFVTASVATLARQRVMPEVTGLDADVWDISNCLGCPQQTERPANRHARSGSWEISLRPGVVTTPARRRPEWHVPQLVDGQGLVWLCSPRSVAVERRGAAIKSVLCLARLFMFDHAGSSIPRSASSSLSLSPFGSRDPAGSLA